MFRSAFSARCEALVQSMLRGSPLALRRCPDFASGWGLFATRQIRPYEEVLREPPHLDSDDRDEELAARYVAAAAGTHLASQPPQDTEYTVASMVRGAIEAGEWPPSRSTKFLGLGWMEDTAGRPTSEDVGDAAEQRARAGIVGRLFDLQDETWGVDEYALLRSKAKTNLIDGCLYLVASKFNHGCDFNVAWNPRSQNDSLIAMRPIGEGEQAFYSYVVGAGRRDKLKARWGLECRCPRCRADL
jgi:hypothetical protein